MLRYRVETRCAALNLSTDQGTSPRVTAYFLPAAANWKAALEWLDETASPVAVRPVLAVDGRAQPATSRLADGRLDAAWVASRGHQHPAVTWTFSRPTRALRATLALGNLGGSSRLRAHARPRTIRLVTDRGDGIVLDVPDARLVR